MINEIYIFKEIELNRKVKTLSTKIITKMLQPYPTNNQMENKIIMNNLKIYFNIKILNIKDY
jgi:hypothetical protein